MRIYQIITIFALIEDLITS